MHDRLSCTTWYKYQRKNKIIPARDTLVLIAISWWVGFQQQVIGRIKSGEILPQPSLVKILLGVVFLLYGILTVLCR